MAGIARQKIAARKAHVVADHDLPANRKGGLPAEIDIAAHDQMRRWRVGGAVAAARYGDLAGHAAIPPHRDAHRAEDERQAAIEIEALAASPFEAGTQHRRPP